MLFKHKINSASRLIMERALGEKFGRSRLPLYADASDIDQAAFDADIAALQLP